MSIIVLIPAILCIIAIFRGSLPRAFVNIFLPVFLVIPDYYYWKTALLPPIDLAEAALLPLGVAILFRELPNWKFTVSDAAVAIFVFTTYYSNALAELHIASIFSLFNSIVVALIPYMIGKLLIEQYGARILVLRRIVFLLFLASVLAIYEYRFGKNPFIRIMDHLFPDERFGWVTQVRWGFYRVAGPFGQSELAGMMLFTGFLFALWLAYQHAWEPKFAHLRNHPFTKSAILCWGLAITLFMTQARGPWIGCLLALPIASIGRARRPGRATVVVAVLLFIIGTAGYIGLTSYLNSATSSGEQQTAQYRQQLLDNYIPIAKAGGAWGWGNNFPRQRGQDSIDNEYLFLALTQGFIGLGAFLVIAWETLVRLTLAAYLNAGRRERSFAFTMLGIFVGILFTISTVYLGNQSFTLFFFLAGWSQALPITRRTKAAQVVFEHVYT